MFLRGKRVLVPAGWLDDPDVTSSHSEASTSTVLVPAGWLDDPDNRIDLDVVLKAGGSGACGMA